MILLIATHNQSKFNRYNQLLKEFAFLKIVSLIDINITTKVEEPFDSAIENAIHKAKEYARISELPTLAIDESVRTNFLPDNQQPGVYVRRHLKSDKEMSDVEQLHHWQEIFGEYSQTNKTFTWDFRIAYFDPKLNKTYSSKVTQVNTIADSFSKKITKGYPMSSFLVPDGYSIPFSELTEKDKLEVDKKTFKNFLEECKLWLQ